MKNKMLIKNISAVCMIFIFVVIVSFSIKIKEKPKTDTITKANSSKVDQDKLNIDKYIDNVIAVIGRDNKIIYDEKSNKFYVTIYEDITNDLNTLIQSYNSSEDEKQKTIESFGLDKIKNDSINLYDELKNKEKDYNLDAGVRIIVNNKTETENISPNILMVDDGNFKDMLCRASENIQKDSLISKVTYKARFGSFIEANVNQNVLIAKFKIEPSSNKKTTIDQNGYNIEDMILNQGADKYNEIQYWAVADMTDGSESKVISFTVDKDLINKIKNKQVVGNQIVDYAKDVWILPGLK